MTCGRCGSTHIHRSRRKGIRDRIQMWLGRWPYRCERCGSRFWAKERRTPRSENTNQRNTVTDTAREGPAMAFRTNAQKPQATIVLQAESHEQLNSILLALNQAVNAYQHAPKEQEYTASSFH